MKITDRRTLITPSTASWPRPSRTWAVAAVDEALRPRLAALRAAVSGHRSI